MQAKGPSGEGKEGSSTMWFTAQEGDGSTAAEESASSSLREGESKEKRKHKHRRHHHHRHKHHKPTCRYYKVSDGVESQYCLLS